MATLEQLNFSRKPGTARLSNRMNSVLLTIKECINEKRLYPALMLIYASIDIMGSLSDPDGYALEKHFEDWVKNHLFKEKTFDCDEVDLYCARCGIVHTMRYDSRQSNKTPKTIVYGFYGYDDDVKKVSTSSDIVSVYIEDLYEAFVAAYKKYLEELEASTDHNINSNLNKLPRYVDLIPLDVA
jgi:hypothetical protein